MHKSIVWILGVIILIGIVVLVAVKPSDSKENENNTAPSPPAGNIESTTVIQMTDSGFEPKNLTITKGTKVTFVNEGTNDHWPASNIHPTHDIYPEFDSLKGLKPGESWTFTFDKEGIWRYHDHLFATINGTITVEN